MGNIKSGDKVICVSTSDVYLIGNINLTLDKVYEVDYVIEPNTIFLVNDDLGGSLGYSKHRFILLSKHRIDKISEILK